MIQRLSSLYSTTWRAIVILLTIEIAIVSLLKYFTMMVEPPSPVVANAFAAPFLPIHVIFSVVALVVAPLQFVRAVRVRWPQAHRVIGRIYIAGCAVGAPTGLFLALGTTAGPLAAGGFAIPAMLWPIFCWLGWRAAVARRITSHRKWMTRGYAMCANAITLRVMLPIAGLLGFDFFTAYPVIAWLSWMTSMAVAEWIVRGGRGSPGHGWTDPAPAHAT